LHGSFDNFGLIAFYKFRRAEMDSSENKDIQHEQSLKIFREANIKFSSIFQYIPVPISIHEIKNRLVVDVNKEYLKLINFSRKEVVGKKIGTLSIWADEKSYTALAKKVKEVKSMSGETFKLKTKDGVIKEVIAAADYFNYDGQDYIITSYFDVTELKRMQDELKIKSAHIEEANTALRVLLRQRERDREEIEEKMLTNVKEIVEPYIKKLNPGTNARSTWEERAQ
jgi:PAS domain S-box-containing protein